MISTIIIFACFCGMFAISFLQQRQIERERKEWQIERNKLLDRIQAGSFIEYKAQERAETPIKRREKDPVLKKLESEPWA